MSVARGPTIPGTTRQALRPRRQTLTRGTPHHCGRLLSCKLIGIVSVTSQRQLQDEARRSQTLEQDVEIMPSDLNPLTEWSSSHLQYRSANSL
jgi:hypothetical protein